MRRRPISLSTPRSSGPPEPPGSLQAAEGVNVQRARSGAVALYILAGLSGFGLMALFRDPSSWSYRTLLWAVSVAGGVALFLLLGYGLQRMSRLAGTAAVALVALTFLSRIIGAVSSGQEERFILQGAIAAVVLYFVGRGTYAVFRHRRAGHPRGFSGAWYGIVTPVIALSLIAIGLPTLARVSRGWGFFPRPGLRVGEEVTADQRLVLDAWEIIGMGEMIDMWHVDSRIHVLDRGLVLTSDRIVFYDTAYDRTVWWSEIPYPELTAADLTDGGYLSLDSDLEHISYALDDEGTADHLYQTILLYWDNSREIEPTEEPVVVGGAGQSGQSD